VLSFVNNEVAVITYLLVVSMHFGSVTNVHW